MNLNDLMEKMKQSSSNKIIYYEDGKRKEKSFSEMYEDVRKVVAYFQTKQFKRGERIGILGKNSYPWVVIDLACIGCGLVTVPLEPNHMVEVDDLVKEYQLSLVLTNLKSSFWLSPLIKPFSEAMNTAPVDSFSPASFEPHDIFTFNFTSGTSGKPKAIELKKMSFDHLVNESQALFNFNDKDRFLVFLPLNVYLERCYVYSAILIGFDLILIGPELVFKALQTEAPTVVIGVPYFFENIKTLFTGKMREKFLLKVLLNTYVACCKIGLGFIFGNRFFPFTKVWGGKMRYLLCGSAPIKREVLEFFELMGLPIYEGYGMNEIGGMITLNAPGHVKLGSVGKTFPGKSIRFDEQGQILVQSSFHGNNRYFKDSDNLIQTTYQGDDCIATGDIGYMDKDGFIFITGRIKDIIILSNGIKVHPAPLEEKMEEMLYIKNCCVFGDNKPYLTALFVLNGQQYTKEELKSKLETLNLALPDEKKVRNFFITNESFSVENGLLTPSFKRNRKYVYQKYALEFEKLY